MLASVWKETLKWLGVPTTFLEGGFGHLKMFKGLVEGSKKAKDMLRVIWFANVFVIWKARNAVVFRQEGFAGEKVVEETKVMSWRILKNRHKHFNFPLYLWISNPLAYLGMLCSVSILILQHWFIYETATVGSVRILVQRGWLYFVLYLAFVAALVVSHKAKSGLAWV
ncbi:hypothetical protein A2U01_0012219 [Trifolium medium]|uniref:Uncharacterized protein n=1 Tax=Trifolium medium TaxID=97028 RepID=A0A392MVG7_9FABA|nr:hypothetical protein [Trifolium medium]